jgi:ABC-2 type transport system ATP-binding protein
MTTALRVTSLCRSYGRHLAVDNLSFEVERGELACLLGPNGAGKSTTMRILAGLQVPDTGEVEIDGTTLSTDPGGIRWKAALTPQELSMFEFLTARESLEVSARLRNVSETEVSQRVERWLDLSGLSGLPDRIVRDFSGGMRRKLAVACTMIAEPPLILLDESFTGLDPESTWKLRAELRRYCQGGGTILLSSHVLDMVQAIADRIIFVARGRQVRVMTRQEMLNLIPSQFPSLMELYMHTIHDVHDPLSGPANT